MEMLSYHSIMVNYILSWRSEFNETNTVVRMVKIQRFGTQAPHRPAPAPVQGVCSPLARLLAWRPESPRGEAALTAASDAGWQSLVERNEYCCSVLKHTLKTLEGFLCTKT